MKQKKTNRLDFNKRIGKDGSFILLKVKNALTGKWESTEDLVFPEENKAGNGREIKNLGNMKKEYLFKEKDNKHDEFYFGRAKIKILKRYIGKKISKFKKGHQKKVIMV